MALEQHRAAAMPAHLAALRNNPAVVVHRPAHRKPFRPSLRVTQPVDPRVLIGRDPKPEAPSQPA